MAHFQRLPALSRKISIKSCQPFESLWKMLPSWLLDPTYPKSNGRYEHADSERFIKKIQKKKIFSVDNLCCCFFPLPSFNPSRLSLIILTALRFCIALCFLPAQNGQQRRLRCPAFRLRRAPWREATSTSSKFVPMAATCMGGRATRATSEYLRLVLQDYLCPFTFKMMWENLISHSSNIKSDLFTTVPSAPPQTVSITVSYEQNNTIHLSWEPPPHDTHNGIIQGYEVMPRECVLMQEWHKLKKYNLLRSLNDILKCYMMEKMWEDLSETRFLKPSILIF